MESPNPIDALNCLKTAEREATKGNYLGAAHAALEAAGRLISCKERQDDNLREAIRTAVGCP